ncbi:MAG: LPS export ABC transporter ATP-binding protein [Thioalkalivibrionaceae bacterium]
MNPPAPAPRRTESNDRPDESTEGLIARGLVKQYGRRVILNGVDINVPPGQIVGLLGPNGAGKTTCFYLIVGLLRAQGGSVQLDGTDLTTLGLPARARHGLGYLAQESSVFRGLSVADNLRAALELRTDLNAANQTATLEALLEEFALTAVRNSPGRALSGGERRRCEIARALASAPRYLCLDEPFAGVDPISVQDLQHTIRSLRDRGIGVLVSDHNVRETLAVCDSAYILSHGKILCHGSPEVLLADPTVRKAYLGERFAL